MQYRVIADRPRRRVQAFVIALAGLLLTACAAVGIDTPGRRFDADKAWAEFVELVSLDYAYFERPGVDGPAILARFAPQARAAKTAGEFIAVNVDVTPAHRGIGAGGQCRPPALRHFSLCGGSPRQ